METDTLSILRYKEYILIIFRIFNFDQLVIIL